MLKIILIAIFFSLTYCTFHVPDLTHPIYQAGDCLLFTDDIPESWETSKNITILKVIELGKTKYHLVYVSPAKWAGNEHSFNNTFETADLIFVKTKCP